MADERAKLLRVGELAKVAGKTVRAMHLYEELGLLTPVARSEGGFRLYDEAAVTRIHWITKLQAIGFTLSEIQGFVSDFERSPSGREATSRARAVFAEKRAAIREQIARLHGIETDLEEALAYLESCSGCAVHFGPSECGVCDHHGHARGQAPSLVAGLSRTPDAPAAAPFDVPVSDLRRDPEGPHGN